MYTFIYYRILVKGQNEFDQQKKTSIIALVDNS